MHANPQSGKVQQTIYTPADRLTHRSRFVIWPRASLPMPISDILACAESDLANIITSDNPWEHGSWFRAKNIGMIELSQLGEMLNVATYDELSQQFKAIRTRKRVGLWPESTPPTLMTKLQALSDAEITDVSTVWSTIEEFSGAWRPSELASYLLALRDYLRENRGPYFLINAM